MHRRGIPLQRLRTGQGLAELGRKWTGRAEPATAWGGMGMFLHNQIAPDSPLKEIVYRNFQQNLDDIVRFGVNSGAKVLLNIVAVSLKDCPPFASMTNRLLSTADRAQFDALYRDWLQAAAQSDFAAAAELFERAARLDPKSAELQFHWGECLLAQSNVVRAREHFQLACDHDALPFRADSGILGLRGEEGEKVLPAGLAGDRESRRRDFSIAGGGPVAGHLERDP